MENKLKRKSKTVKKPRGQKKLEEHWTEFETPSGKLTKAQQRNIARQLYNHVRNDNVFDIISICGELDICETTWEKYVSTYPVIKEANNRAKSYLAGKRFNQASQKKASEKLFLWAAQYSKAHKEHLEYLENIKDQPTARKLAEIIVQQIAIPDTDVVHAPKKETEGHEHTVEDHTESISAEVVSE